MNLRAVRRRLALAGLALSSVLLVGRASADEAIKGQVLGGGAPIANSKRLTMKVGLKFALLGRRLTRVSICLPSVANPKSGAVATTQQSRCWQFWVANLQPMSSSMR